MGYFKYKPSKAKAKEFYNKMQEIDTFCNNNGIERSTNSDSYYFTINGINYRVSNHSVEASNRGAFADGIQIRDLYHENGREKNTIYIHASKTRIIEIYNNLKSGYKLDGKGNIKNEN